MSNFAHTQVHTPIWLQNEPLTQRFEKLTTTHRSDVAIIGGGITGLSTALELLQRGYSVTIYEAFVVGAGTTTGSTGHLDAYPEMGIEQLIRDIGIDKARTYLSMHMNSINVIEKRAGDRCDLRRIPAYYYSEDTVDDVFFKGEFESSILAGLPATWVETYPVKHAKTGFRIDRMGRMDMNAYLQSLVNEVIAHGGTIFEDSRVIAKMDERPRQFKAGDGTAEFSKVVCCVHWNPTDSTMIDLQIPSYLSYALVAELETPFPDVLLWDNADPYFYVRRLNSSEEHRIVVGGCDHRTGSGNPRKAINDLEAYVRARFSVRSISSPWSAEYFYPTDGLPLIGLVPKKENVWIATGLSGVGLTTATVAAQLIAKQIANEPVELREELSPSRFSVKNLGTVISEQSTAVINYADRVLPAKTINAEELILGQGAVGKVEGVHTAVCRDLSGKLHKRSPICTHMGGVVRWNEFEQSWDCPIHGGRFSACGKPFYGPPSEELDPK